MSSLKGLHSDATTTNLARVKLHALQVCLDAYVQRLSPNLKLIRIHCHTSRFEEHMRDARKCMEEIATLEKEVKEIALAYPGLLPLTPE